MERRGTRRAHRPARRRRRGSPRPHRPPPGPPGHGGARLLRPPGRRRRGRPRRPRGAGRQRPRRCSLPRSAHDPAHVGPGRPARRPRGQRQGALPDPPLSADPRARPHAGPPGRGQRHPGRRRPPPRPTPRVDRSRPGQPLGALPALRVGLPVVLHGAPPAGRGHRAGSHAVRPGGRRAPPPGLAGRHARRPRLPPPDRGLLRRPRPGCGGGAAPSRAPPTGRAGGRPRPGRRARGPAIGPLPDPGAEPGRSGRRPQPQLGPVGLRPSPGRRLQLGHPGRRLSS